VILRAHGIEAGKVTLLAMQGEFVLGRKIKIVKEITSSSGHPAPNPV
jgi:hypothetical protein